MIEQVRFATPWRLYGEALLQDIMDSEEVEVSESEPVIDRMKRRAVVWRCSSVEWAYPRGKTPKAACGRYNSIWTLFDPDEGGNRKKRWLGRCPCGKTTALNPESGNIIKDFEKKSECIEYAEKMNDEQTDDTVLEGWLQ